jgi:hypothetical protein
MSYTLVVEDILIVLDDFCEGLEHPISALDHVL